MPANKRPIKGLPKLIFRFQKEKIGKEIISAIKKLVLNEIGSHLGIF